MPLKNICLLIYFDKEPDFAKSLVITAMKMATYPKQLQFIFFIGADNVRMSRPFEDVVHELYRKYEPDLFDPFPIPTIKQHLDAPMPESVAIQKIIHRADAKIKVECPVDFVFERKGWDEILIKENEGSNSSVFYDKPSFLGVIKNAVVNA